MISPAIINTAAWVGAGIICSQIFAVAIVYLVVRGYNAIKGGYVSLDNAYYVVNLSMGVVVTVLVACAVLGALAGVWMSRYVGEGGGGSEV